MPRDGGDVKRRRSRRVPATLVVRVPEAQRPFLHLPGPHGGDFISLLWNFGANVEMAWNDLRELLKMRDGSVILARRMSASEAQLLENHRADCDQEAHARVIRNEATRWARAAPKRRHR